MRDYIPLAYEVREQTLEEAEQRRAAASATAQKLIDDRLAREAEQAAARDRLDAERGAAELDAYRTEARASMRASGGSSADFERLWPELRGDYLKARALQRMGARERRAEEMYRKMGGRASQR